MNAEKIKLVDSMLLSGEDKETMDSFCISLVATSIVANVSIDEVLNESIVMVRAKLLNMEKDGTLDKIKKANVEVKAMFEKILGFKI